MCLSSTRKTAEVPRIIELAISLWLIRSDIVFLLTVLFTHTQYVVTGKIGG